ncbi:MAG TPA: Lrp/AsnC family transcriptional regulator [Solirubrobacterales bacterium]|nr:Lrp/AsnC family transcriptional regulator [Solirubrobacterales bacterium]
MALSDDQKAILRLLAQRGEQGYDDLAALMGISVAEVHSRAQKAAAELEAEGIPAPSIPAPGASPPDTPKAPARPSKPEPVEPIPRHERGRSPKEIVREAKLLEKRGLWAVLAGVAIVVLFVVILLVSGGGGGSGSSGTTTTTADKEANQALEEAAAKQGKEVTKAVLNPVDGGESSGLAVFGRVKKKLALQVFAQGLEATGKSDAYTIWLAASEAKMLPLASTPVGKDGKISAQVEVPVEVLAYLANETFNQITITRTDDSQLEASLAKATREKKAPVYTGTAVLRGAVTGPIVGAASREKEGK